jgi:hypothetical protein
VEAAYLGGVEHDGDEAHAPSCRGGSSGRFSTPFRSDGEEPLEGGRVERIAVDDEEALLREKPIEREQRSEKPSRAPEQLIQGPPAPCAPTAGVKGKLAAMTPSRGRSRESGGWA